MKLRSNWFNGRQTLEQIFCPKVWLSALGTPVWLLWLHCLLLPFNSSLFIRIYVTVNLRNYSILTPKILIYLLKVLLDHFNDILASSLTSKEQSHLIRHEEQASLHGSSFLLVPSSNNVWLHIDATRAGSYTYLLFNCIFNFLTTSFTELFSLV